MLKSIDSRQNSIRRVADDYLFSSAALFMFRFDKYYSLCAHKYYHKYKEIREVQMTNIIHFSLKEANKYK